MEIKRKGAFQGTQELEKVGTTYTLDGKPHDVYKVVVNDKDQGIIFNEGFEHGQQSSDISLQYKWGGANSISLDKDNKAEIGHFKKAGVEAKKHLKEFRLDKASEMNVGDVVSADTFAAGEKVDITGITKGHGYTGTVKRWGNHILRMTHGTGPIHRQPGSMGVIDPARIFKNKKMAGQYGNEQVTVLNLAVVKIDAEKNIIAVKGAVPGAKGGIVFIRDSVKA